MNDQNLAAEQPQASEDKMQTVRNERMSELLQTRAQFIPSSVDAETRIRRGDLDNGRACVASESRRFLLSRSCH